MDNTSQDWRSEAGSRKGADYDIEGDGSIRSRGGGNAGHDDSVEKEGAQYAIHGGAGE